jgi:hypothetical protein
MTLLAIWRIGLTFILGLLLTAPLLAQLDNQPLFFVQVGAGDYANLSFRTEFHLSNESPEEVDGQFTFFNHQGLPEDFQVIGDWTGDPGKLQTEGNRSVFSLLPRSGLTLKLASRAQISFGWARLEGSGDYSVRALFQQAEAIGPTDELSDFEDRLMREVEIAPSTGLKEFAFPVSLFQGHQEINTAFALVNLSSQEADLSIRLRPDEVETVTVQPGHLFSSYFTDFWQLAFPAIFPLRVASLAEVQSEVPWAVTVFRTRQGLPLSGVPPTPMSRTKEETIQAELGQEFELSVNQTAQISSESLEIEFRDVTEDSRCPIGATCIWEGRASIVIRVTKAGEVLGDFTLTSHDGYADLAILEISGYVIQLLDVAPVPEVGKGPIEVSDYVVTFVVK